MPIEVEAPDGSIVQFPDDIDPGQIKTIMRQKFGGPEGAQMPNPAQPRDAATVQAEFDAMPWYAKAGQAADDIVRATANGITFGYADKLAGYMNDTGAEVERAKSQEAMDRAGWAGTTAEIAGSMLPMGVLAKGGVTAGTLVPKAAQMGVPGVLARPLAAGIDGAAFGALSATGHDTNVAEGAILGGVTGTAAGVVGEGVSAGLNKLGGMFNKAPAVPSIDDIRSQKNAAYGRSEEAGVIINQPSMKRLQTDITSELADFGYIPENQPKVANILNAIGRMSDDNVTLKGFDNLRKVAVQLTKSQDASEREIAGRLIGIMDDFATRLGPDDVMTGNTELATQALKEGRELAKRQAKAEAVDAAMMKAERQAASGGSGGNIDNATRQKFKEILNNPKRARMFSQAERQAMESIVRGDAGGNLARLVGKAAPTGIVSSGLGAGAGALLGGPIGAAVVPAVGYAAKQFADDATLKAAEKLSAQIRAGGASIEAAPNAVQRLAQSKREALVRALTAMGIIGAQSPLPR